MAILRAGPFASTVDSFLDEPGSAIPGVVPVNCAKDRSSSSWPWKCYVSVGDIQNYLNGFQSLSRNESENIPEWDSLSVAIKFAFYVQCSEEITFTMTYDLSATSPANYFATASVQVSTNGFSDYESESDEGFGTAVTASITGSRTITIPKSVKPQYVSFFAYASSVASLDGGNGSVDLSLSFS